MTINTPDIYDNRLINAFCIAYGYRAKLEDGTDNPITKELFTKNTIRSFIKSVLVSVELKTATEKVSKETLQVINNEVTI